MNMRAIVVMTVVAVVLAGGAGWWAFSPDSANNESSLTAPTGTGETMQRKAGGGQKDF